LTHLEAETVAAYIDRGLSAADTVAVDSHLAECPECRSEVVQLDALLRARRGVRRPVLLAVGLTAAAAVLVFAILPGSRPSDSRSRSLGDLLQPPVYLGVSVRAPAERAATLFTDGMRLYNEGKYADAAERLRAARDAGIDGAAPTFFLGASLLMLNEPNRASDEFATVVRMGQTPYLAEAHYYRAKALLRVGDSGGAVAELDRAIETADESFRIVAQSFRDSVRAIRQP
jgi:tetratricopeptide (TPR) repeat protein